MSKFIWRWCIIDERGRLNSRFRGWYLAKHILVQTASKVGKHHYMLQNIERRKEQDWNLQRETKLKIGQNSTKLKSGKNPQNWKFGKLNTIEKSTKKENWTKLKNRANRQIWILDINENRVNWKKDKIENWISGKKRTK